MNNPGVESASSAGDLPQRVLVASCSARVLADSARKAGIRVVSLDHYADRETRDVSERAFAIVRDGGGFDRDVLLDTALRWAPPQHYPLIYGSGFDSDPPLLVELAMGREVIGNPPAVHQLFREPRQFFELLDRCDIQHPSICFDRPTDPENWLIKSGCSEGGKRVRFCAEESAGPSDYYQRTVQGDACSLLFLANGTSAVAIGFNTMWTVQHAPYRFLFVGAVNHVVLSDSQRRQLEGYVLKLVESTGLRGINSLDFLVDARGKPQVIEVNTRPSATMALYDADYPQGILAAHIRACRGDLTSKLPGCGLRAFRTVLARDQIAVGSRLVWPDWCADKPVSGEVIQPGQPVCTILAQAANSADVTGLIHSRTRQLESLLQSRLK